MQHGKHFCVKTFENTALYFSNDFIDYLIYRIKVQREKELLLLFKKDLRAISKQFKGYSIIVVPLSKKRLQERTFNQSLIIAKMLNLPIIDCLKRLDDSTQSLKTFQERLKNPPVFQLTKKISGKKILIIDDIYTTGATLLQIYELLEFDNIVKTFTLIRKI